jgi:hypothetical protein
VFHNKRRRRRRGLVCFRFETEKLKETKTGWIFRFGTIIEGFGF